MIRNYRIEWFKNEKYREPMKRHSFIKVTSASGKVEKDAKQALELFVSEFGSLKYNTIVKIQELDENMEQIGEDIIPQDDVSIIPTKR